MPKVETRKREEVLILHSKSLHIYLTGFITAILFTAILFFILWNVHGHQMNEKITLSCLFFFIVCFISSDIINLEYSLLNKRNLNYKPPFQFILVFVILLVVGFINFPDKIQYSRKYLLSKYTFEFILPFIFFGLVIVDPVYLIIRTVFFKLLEFIGGMDYKLILDGVVFQHNLEIKFSNTQRYGGALTLIAFTTVCYDEDKITTLSMKHQKKINSSVINIMRQNMRITDVLGNFEEGKVGGILSNTDIDGAKVAAHRILGILYNHQDLKKEFEKYNMNIKCGISRYVPEMKHCNDLIEKALLSLNKAIEDRSLKIYYMQ